MPNVMGKKFPYTKAGKAAAKKAAATTNQSWPTRARTVSGNSCTTQPPTPAPAASPKLVEWQAPWGPCNAAVTYAHC